MFNLIRNHQININRPLRICEIGVDSGQMRCYKENTKPIDIECWDAVDKKIKPILMQFGYNQKIEANVDKNDFELNDQYDVIIVLHLLEHLFEPESLISKLSTALKPDGIIIGGFPAVPDF
jgi:2-polyprenyl-3-methyl-5-hydroxy-6-metoxy-1,4-benzoquinol methylase